MTNWVVAKFGGTSMGSIETMRQCAHIVEIQRANVVLVSATSGTTNQLVELADLAMAAEQDKATEILDAIESKHLEMLLSIPHEPESLERLKSYLRELRTLVKGCSLLRECSPRAYDALMSTGELLSSTIFTAIMSQASEKNVIWLDSRQVISTDNQHGKARPQLEKIQQNCQAKISDPQSIYIGQGFIGQGANGLVTTLGRGGSDYSAALIAEGLNAHLLQIWTDVPGMASADPRLCSNALSIKAISIKEASEMATFGAKILHPASLAPAVRKKIPVFVGSTFEPDMAGTTITERVDDRPVVRAVTLRNNQVLMSISNPDMLSASGFLHRVFEVYDRYEISVDAITTSEISVAVTVDQNEYPNGEKASLFLAELEALGSVKVETQLSLIAIVGNELNRTPGLGEQIFKSLSNINVRMITHGASSHNFCIIVDGDMAQTAVKQLHDKLVISGINNV